MAKIKHFFSSLKHHLTPKNIGIALVSLLVLMGLLFWFQTKAKVSIKEHVFLVAVDNSWAALDLHGQEGYMQGFVSELIETIAREEGVRMRLVSVGPSFLADNLEKGHYDGIISLLDPDVLNEEKYLFSEPFYLTGPVLLVPSNSKVKSLGELHTVGVKTGHLSVFSGVDQSKTSFIPFYNMNMALSELRSGRIDGLIMESLDAYAYVKGYYADKFKVVTPPLDQKGLRVVALHNFFGKHLIKLFDGGLKKLKEDKTYDKLLEAWDLVNPETAFQK